MNLDYMGKAEGFDLVRFRLIEADYQFCFLAYCPRTILFY